MKSNPKKTMKKLAKKSAPVEEVVETTEEVKTEETVETTEENK